MWISFPSSRQWIAPRSFPTCSFPCGIWPRPCPDCSSKLSLMIGKYGPFYGCRRYPLCDGSRNLGGSTEKPWEIAADFTRPLSDAYGYSPDWDDDSFPPPFLNGGYSR